MISQQQSALALVVLAAVAGCASDNDPTGPSGAPQYYIAARTMMTQCALVNTAVGVPPSVVVVDAASGFRVAGVTVTFEVTDGSGTRLPMTPVVTDGDGFATLESWTLGATPGANALRATATGSGTYGNPVLFTAVGVTDLGFAQQGSKLVGSDALGNARQGSSVSLSADGNTALVGGPADNGSMGAAWVWIRTGGVWTQQGPKLVGTGVVGYASQGWSVALSADGNTALVGGPSDDGWTGAAWVWTRSGGVWTQQGPKLVDTVDFLGISGQGFRVSLSGDGNTALIGGGDLFGNLVARVWTRSGGVWTELFGNGPFGASSLSMSADGVTAVVGADLDDSEVGGAWVWTRSGEAWTQQGPMLVGTGSAGRAFQGASLSLSADGNTAMVGGHEDDQHDGAAWVWTRSGGVWSQQGSKLVGSGATRFAGQGSSVSLSADGNMAIVGGPQDANSDGNGGVGAAWIWRRSGGVWSQEGCKLVGTGAVGRSSQGASVSLSADGNSALVGGPYDSGDAGAAWVFREP